MIISASGEGGLWHNILLNSSYKGRKYSEPLTGGRGATSDRSINHCVTRHWMRHLFLPVVNSIDEARRGGRPFNLNEREFSPLGVEAEKGNCASAYKLAQYHLYSSLALQEAEKYFRRAAKCQNADALVGLITILRKPANDTEIDDLVISLKKIDAKRGKSASEEVALRRVE